MFNWSINCAMPPPIPMADSSARPFSAIRSDRCPPRWIGSVPAAQWIAKLAHEQGGRAPAGILRPCSSLLCEPLPAAGSYLWFSAAKDEGDRIQLSCYHHSLLEILCSGTRGLAKFWEMRVTETSPRSTQRTQRTQRFLSHFRPAMGLALLNELID